MKNYFALSFLFVFLSFHETNAQSRGIRIGYIDMEYILEHVPDYTEAKSQLEQKAQKWKQDIEAKKVEIAKLKDALKTEKALLTKELIEEREEEIAFQESELLDFQQKKFGPNGELMTQKAVLVKPIQDQVFNAVQDIAELKKFDYVFDKSSDLTMLFAAKRHDISDQIVRSITRSEKREQLSKKQLKEQEAKEYEENLEDENPALAARRKALEDKKAAREKLVQERKAAAEARKKEMEEKRNGAKETKTSEKTGTIPDTTQTDKDSKTEATDKKEADSTAAQSKDEKAAAREKVLADRKKALEDRKKKIIEEREAAKKAKEGNKQEENKQEEN